MSGRGPEPNPTERAIGYVVPIVLCGLLGAGVTGWMYASGGPRRSRFDDRRTERALAATKDGLKLWAAAGFLVGGVVGAGIAYRSEQGDV